MYKYFHLCTHETKVNNDENNTRIVNVKNGGGLIDTLILGATVLEIAEIRVLEYDPSLDRKELVYDEPTGRYTYEDEDEDEGFYDDPSVYFIKYGDFFPEGAVISEPLPRYAFEPYVHNRIKWNVTPPIEYEATIRVRFPKAGVMRHEPKDCPICQGKGWFVDLLSNHGRFNLDRGIEKIVQRILKDLLTELYTNKLSLEYGTMLNQVIATTNTDDEAMFDDIRMIVSEVEDLYLARQTEVASNLLKEESLRSCTVSKIHRSARDQRRIVLELRIQTESELRDFKFIV